MKDRIPGAPGQFSATVDGSQLQKLQRGEPFTITLKRDDQPIEEGTPYSKAAVLPDALAARICPSLEDPAPADAFAALADQGVVSQGKKDGWTYRQWANGMAELWRTIENPSAANERLDFPFNFKGWPAELTINNSVTMNSGRTVIVRFYNGGFHPPRDPETSSPDFTKTCGMDYAVIVYDWQNQNWSNDNSDMILNLHIVGEWEDIVNSGGSYPVWEGGLY